MAYGIPNHTFICSAFSFQMLPVPLGSRALKRSHCCSRSFRTSGSSPWILMVTIGPPKSAAFRGEDLGGLGMKYVVPEKQTCNDPLIPFWILFGLLMNTCTQIFVNVCVTKILSQSRQKLQGTENMITMTKNPLIFRPGTKLLPVYKTIFIR